MGRNDTNIKTAKETKSSLDQRLKEAGNGLGKTNLFMNQKGNKANTKPARVTSSRAVKIMFKSSGMAIIIQATSEVEITNARS